MDETNQLIISAMSEIMELNNAGRFEQDEVIKILEDYFNPVIRERNDLLSYLKGNVIDNTANFISGFKEL